MGNTDNNEKQGLRGFDRKDDELFRLMKKRGIADHFPTTNYILP